MCSKPGHGPQRGLHLADHKTLCSPEAAVLPPPLPEYRVAVVDAASGGDAMVLLVPVQQLDAGGQLVLGTASRAVATPRLPEAHAQLLLEVICSAEGVLAQMKRCTSQVDCKQQCWAACLPSSVNSKLPPTSFGGSLRSVWRTRHLLTSSTVAHRQRAAVAVVDVEQVLEHLCFRPHLKATQNGNKLGM